MADDEFCRATQIKVKLESQGEGLSEKDVRDLVGDPQNVRYARVLETGFHTVDGRLAPNVGILSTPGGDAGEFILALQIYSDLMAQGSYLKLDQVKNILREYLLYMTQPKFHMATDDQAILHLEKEIYAYGLNISNPQNS